MKKIKILLGVSLLLISGCAKPNVTSNTTQDSAGNVTINATSNYINSVTSNNTQSVISNNTQNNYTFNQVSDNYVGSYYNNISTSKTGSDLLDELQVLIKTNYKAVGYDGLWRAYRTTDCKPGTNTIWDIYSNYVFDVDKDHGSPATYGDCYNREHTTPQSWWGGGTGPDQGNDLFNVYPTDGKVNSDRGNYPYGEVGTATKTSNNGCKLGKCSFEGYSGTVFEVTDEFKGDIARTMFYMVTRYDQRTNCFNKSEGSKVYKSSFPYLTDFALNLFIKWSNQDPVSQKEIDRNNAVYALQKNRNPYIDNPSMISRVFGGNSGTYVPPSPTPTPTEYEIVTAPQVNVEYHLGFSQNNLNKMLFATGETTNLAYYLATTESYENSAIARLESNQDGYSISVTNNGTKKYINLVFNNGHYNISLDLNPSSIWSYDSTYNTFTSLCNGEKCYIGTHDSYATISCSLYSKISSSFPCHLYK